MQYLRERLKKPGFRYVFVGGTIYVLELVVIYAAERLGTSSVVAVAYSFTIGLIISFVLQKFFTFGDRRTHHRVIAAQVVAVGLLVLFNFGFTLLVTKQFDGILSPMITRTGALGVTTIWNYYLYKTRIFKQVNRDVPID